MSSTGFVFATTGETYTTLARRAARSLRLIHPEAGIDLFTDQPVEDDVFDRVVPLEDVWFRPKMEALSRSRFDRTVYLDADIMVIAPIDSIFDVLDRFDLVACIDRYLNNAFGRMQHGTEMPNAFPVLNGGVLGLRGTKEGVDFVRAWQQEMKDTDATRDQPVLRSLLFQSDLRYATLPPQYNLLTFKELSVWQGYYGAPRLLHNARLHRSRLGPGDPMTPFRMEEVVGRLNAWRLRQLIKADVALTPGLPLYDRPMNNTWEIRPLRVLRHRVAPWVHRLLESKPRG